MMVEFIVNCRLAMDFFFQYLTCFAHGTQAYIFLTHYASSWLRRHLPVTRTSRSEGDIDISHRVRCDKFVCLNELDLNNPPDCPKKKKFRTIISFLDLSRAHLVILAKLVRHSMRRVGMQSNLFWAKFFFFLLLMKTGSALFVGFFFFASCICSKYRAAELSALSNHSVC